MDQTRNKDFNIYYLNFSKVYEIAMMINNVILTRIEKDRSNSIEEQLGYTSSFSAQGSKHFLDGIKSSISAESKETSFSSSKVVESLDVKTTKSILLRRIIEKCTVVNSFEKVIEGDLIKVDNVKLELLDEESLRQFLILRRDALKGMRVEGMEVNNLISSMLQDYAYILKGTITGGEKTTSKNDILIKIPMEIKSEFENKYCIDDLLIGHVSIVGIFKGTVKESFISSNTFNYWQGVGSKQQSPTSETQKIIKSDSFPVKNELTNASDNCEYQFIDTIAIIQDVSFDLPKQNSKKMHWWNKIGLWLINLGRRK